MSSGPRRSSGRRPARPPAAAPAAGRTPRPAMRRPRPDPRCRARTVRRRAKRGERARTIDRHDRDHLPFLLGLATTSRSPGALADTTSPIRPADDARDRDFVARNAEPWHAATPDPPPRRAAASTAPGLLRPRATATARSRRCPAAIPARAGRAARPYRHPRSHRAIRACCRGLPQRVHDKVQALEPRTCASIISAKPEIALVGVRSSWTRARNASAVGAISY